jgi:hypothetical protein
MTNALYASSIPLFKQMLGGLKSVLARAEAHAVDKKIDPTAKAAKARACKTEPSLLMRWCWKAAAGPRTT